MSTSSPVPVLIALLVSCLIAAPRPLHAATGTSRHPSLDIAPLEARVDRQITDGEWVEAFAGAVEALRYRVATNGPRSPETLNALCRIARAVHDPEIDHAIWSIVRVAAVEVSGSRHPMVAEALAGLGTATKWVSPSFDDMKPYFREALSILDEEVPEQRGLASRIYRSEGFYNWYRDRERSIAQFEKALQIQSELPDQERESAATRAWLGWTLLQLGRHEEARIHLELAREELDLLGLGDVSIMGTIKSALADLDVLAGDWARAERGYLDAIRCYERARRVGSTRFSEFPLHGYNLVALAQLKQGRPEEAWKSLQTYRGSAGKRLRYLNEWKQRSPQSYALVRELREEVTTHRELRRHQRPVQSLADVNWAAMIEELDVNARLFRMEAAYYAPVVASAAGITELQATLPDDHAYVGWLESKVGDELLASAGPILDARWIYVVRSRGPVVWIPLWENTTNRAQNAIRRDASDYGEMMERASEWTLRVNDDPKLSRLGRLLAEQEFDAAIPFLSGVDHLVVEFFEDRVAWKPIEALILPDGRYLCERFAVTYSPSADAFIASRRVTASGAAAPTVLAIGDPIFNPFTADTLALESATVGIDRTLHRAATNGDTAALNALPRLPYAREELNNVQRSFPGAVMMRGEEATETSVRRIFEGPDGATFSIVHIATHALTETPMSHRCALAFTRRGLDGTPHNDGLVDVLEIQLGWNLDAELVTLSGCQTVSASVWLRGEPIGLAATFLSTGARSVVSNLWKVDDLSAAKLMSRFYENLSGRYSGPAGQRDGRPMTKAVALVEAKQWLRTYKDSSGRQPFAHPIYWSGFILLGDPD